MNQKGFVNIIVILIIVAITGALGYFIVNRQTPPSFSPTPSPTTDKTVVNWEEAIRILNSGQVVDVMQTHSLDVSLTLKDGKVIQTKEPEIDAIFKEVSKCVVCKDTIISTSTE